jgi:methionine sulfoxide reductase heme-binding subunit
MTGLTPALPKRASYWARRTRRHAAVGLASVALTAAIFAVVESRFTLSRLSTAFAFSGLALVCASLAIGPSNVLRNRPNPLSTDLRRDVGIWAGLLSLAHVVLGFQVHMGGRFWEYFFYGNQPRLVRLRFDPFGLANYAGLGITLVILLLLALSNDISLRRLGSRRWKAWHRLLYVGFALTLAHGALYQLLEKRHLPFVGLFAGMVLAVCALQLLAFRKVRRRQIPRRPRLQGGVDRTDSVAPR